MLIYTITILKAPFGNFSFNNLAQPGKLGGRSDGMATNGSL